MEVDADSVSHEDSEDLWPLDSYERSFLSLTVCLVPVYHVMRNSELGKSLT